MTVVLCATLSAGLAAQQAPLTYPEFRADAIVANGTTVQGGVGVVLPVGVYARIDVDGAVGGRWHGGASSAEGRIDMIARFLLDPLRENNVALSFGGGLSAPIAGNGFGTPLLTLVMDVEGRRRSGITPALEVGLGGGARIGVVLRRSPPRWR